LSSAEAFHLLGGVLQNVVESVLFEAIDRKDQLLFEDTDRMGVCGSLRVPEGPDSRIGIVGVLMFSIIPLDTMLEIGEICSQQASQEGRHPKIEITIRSSTFLR